MTSTIEKDISTIQHLVLSGGTVWGLNMIGMLNEAISTNFLSMSNIKTIHATSVGSIVGTAFSLKIDPNILQDYFVKRPWDKFSKKNRNSILDIYDHKGVIHSGFFKDLFESLFKSIDLSCDVTFAELYEYNGIELHIYATELNKYELVDFSFKTHPEWNVIDVIYASCSIPLLFSPYIKDDQCFIDGGFLLNYPITKCIIENPKEVLGISLANFPDQHRENPIGHSSNIFDYIFSVMYNIIYQHGLFSNDNSHPYPYQIVLKDKTSLEYFIIVLSDKNEREHLVMDGKRIFKEHLDKWCNI